MPKTTFIAAGDTFATRLLPPGGYPGFRQLQEHISGHDVRFINLESTFHNCEGTPAAVSGGTWAMSDPMILNDILAYGFNIFNTANNHSCDYSHDGVTATIRHLRERNMVFSGTGKDLAEASRPCYLETEHARVALISVSIPSHPTIAAGASTPYLPGRPGLNPLRFTKTHHLDEEHYAMLEQLNAVTKVNAKTDRSISIGYTKPPKPGAITFAGQRFVLDDHCWTESVPNEQDMRRIEGEIREACRQADIVLVSFHAHEWDWDKGKTNIPAPFIETFSHRCIDAGAKTVIGHGPHELQGIELYGNGIIFYSVGNFIFQTETVADQPGDSFSKKDLPMDTRVGEFMDARSKNGTIGYGTLPEIWNSVLPSWTIEDGKITEVTLYPISLGQELPRSRKGVPVPVKDETWLHYLAELSAPYGTKITIENGLGRVVLE